jgi:hypothetical protein
MKDPSVSAEIIELTRGPQGDVPYGNPFGPGKTPGQACERTSEGQPGEAGSPPFCEEDTPPVDEPEDPIIPPGDEPDPVDNEIEIPVDETPVDETPVDEAPVDEAPVAETPVAEEPSEELEGEPVALVPAVSMESLPVTGGSELGLALIGAVLMLAGRRLIKAF